MLAVGQVLVRLATLGTFVETAHDDRDAVVGQGELDIIHDQTMTIGETRLSVDVGLPDGFGASLLVPIRLVRSRIRYLAASDGSEVMLENAGVHHRNETLTGLVDPMLLGSYARMLGAVRVVGRAGLTLPLGRTEANPFTAAAETTPHQHVQMGTGTITPVLAAEVAYSTGDWTFGGFAFTQQSLYENGKGYQAGDRYAAGLALRRRLGATWTLRGGLETQLESAERWNDVVHTDDGNRGRIDALVAAGVSYAATRALSFDLAIKVPFVTHAVGGQLDMPAIVELGAAWSFGGAAATPAADEHGHDHGEHDHAHGDAHGDDHGDDHGDAHGDAHGPDAHGDEHGDAHGPDAHGPDAHGAGDDHGHGDEHGMPTPTPDGTTTAPDPTTQPTKPTKPTKPTTPAKPAHKADIADLTPSGAAVPIVPVKGKVTIVDFWAPWCGPCKTLDPALAELARKHPHVALRKLDVVDWDSEAAAKYLTPGRFDLPHVKIYDASGTLVFEQTPKPGALNDYIAAIRKLVEASAPRRR